MQRALRQLLRRQLPQVNQRLQRTLDKRPSARFHARIECGAWWNIVQQRYALRGGQL
jgi:hypothetical protein